MKKIVLVGSVQESASCSAMSCHLLSSEILHRGDNCKKRGKLSAYHNFTGTIAFPFPQRHPLAPCARGWFTGAM